MVEQALRCPVCLGTYRDPHVLSPCGHTFCGDCVKKLPAPPATRWGNPNTMTYVPPMPAGTEEWAYDRSRRPTRTEYTRLCPVCRTAFEPRHVHPNYALMLLMQDIQESGDLSSRARDSDVGVATKLSQIVRPVPGSTACADALKELNRLGVPWGLARLIRAEDRMIAVRIFLLDNSSSTTAFDGRLLMQDDDPLKPWIRRRCTRWEEISRAALQQAEWNLRVGTPCEFFLLNPPSQRPTGAFRDGVDFVRVDPCQGDGIAQRIRLRDMLLATVSRGNTPLATRLTEIYHRVSREHGDLVAAGQRVVLVVVTDGLPTSEYQGKSTPLDRKTLVDVLRRLCTDLPVHIVIRLATEDPDVIEFYGLVDDEPELALEVIDDLESEARAVCNKGNVWLAYSPMIHTIREGGTFVKLFDVIDERKLTTMEALLLAHMLLQEEGDGAPPVDVKDFCNFAASRVAKLSQVYEPVTRRMAPVIAVANLRMQIVPMTGLCPWRRRALTPAIKGAWWRHPLMLLQKRNWHSICPDPIVPSDWSDALPYNDRAPVTNVPLESNNSDVEYIKSVHDAENGGSDVEEMLEELRLARPSGLRLAGATRVGTY